ncbi:hypothetical protein KL930_002055 [Ogataea haglerorum]|uniref:CCHC-type domain-containing protein n=1 Tax=Ogataea haglerorum TaxID=1937702 RepID=A0AAN6I102_9ASCO|nr:uncharacterized protein KL911_000340 [Ogataea haglerorum]KAG7699158.1 hypothetical protein KL915_001450 [Ogataea haglerorum]KAG7700760.1 hypothetical protein KL951_000875 [Ogataea haglerorum]KAG7711019.1 hypothetical protein KL950_000985 [Ogataea haglerorum]KAG7720317.1 hypothetical protein KL913_001217 [Ogataea haglerorum]KAG7720703.1 hypothetical protein KL949_001575 [Ogataea haglerorum]
MNNQVDQLATVNEAIRALAEKIAHKEQELDQLKTAYNEKIGELDRYLEKLKNLEIIQDGQNVAEEVVKIKEFRCPDCKALLYDETKQTDYILLPNKVKLQTSKHNQCDMPARQNVISKRITVAPSKNKKMTCSYCMKHGHKRAQCPEILYGKSG